LGFWGFGATPDSAPAPAPWPSHQLSRSQLSLPHGGTGLTSSGHWTRRAHPPSPSRHLYSLQAEGEKQTEEEAQIMRLAEAVTVAWCLNMGVTEEVPIPGSLKEAFSCPQAPYWRVAVGDELERTRGLVPGTRSQFDLPGGMHAIDTKWLFGLKRDSEGRIVRFKARLVARGFTQVHGLDFDETHSSVARWGTIRSLLALSAGHGWAVQVADVNNAFLNAPLAEEVYIKVPEGVEGPRGKVLRLRMAPVWSQAGP